MTPLIADKCSKCGDALDLMVASGTAKWCRKCRARYQAEYGTTKLLQAEAQGFARGAQAMRNQIASKFAPFPMAIFGGSEVVRCIANVDAPAASVAETAFNGNQRLC